MSLISFLRSRGRFSKKSNEELMLWYYPPKIRSFKYLDEIYIKNYSLCVPGILVSFHCGTNFSSNVHSLIASRWTAEAAKGMKAT
jgi:hypothetical protein